MLIDASQDYLVWDNTEAVTLYSHATASDTGFTIPTAKRTEATYKEQLPTGGAYGAALAGFLLPAVLVTAAGAVGLKAPKPADVIEDAAGVRYTVQSAILNQLRSVWRCVALDLSLAYDLRDTISVQRPQSFQITENPLVSTDAAGSRTYSYGTIYTGVAARIQETDADTVDERGKRLTRKKYNAPVGQRLVLTIEDQVIDQAGNVYEVKGWKDADRIDQLQQLELERRW